MANAEVFDSYFRRADLNKDGRISGQEAVAFFQGAGLPQMTLAKVASLQRGVLSFPKEFGEGVELSRSMVRKNHRMMEVKSVSILIWQFADQGRSGFLSRVEFYNALKLVTVAQTGRDLTPELVRAALTGPAAAQIPPPRINTPPGPVSGSGQPANQAGPPGAAPAFPSSVTNVQTATSLQPSGSSAQRVNERQAPQPPSSQGTNGGVQPRQLTTQVASLSGSQADYGGAPAKKFSPHTNSAPTTQLGHGGPPKQLSPQTSSVSGGSRLTSQTSSLSRYPPSLGQVQVAPTGFGTQNMAGPPAPGSQQTRPSLGSLFTTNSAWPPKGSAPVAVSQPSNSTSGNSVPSSLTTPTLVPSRPGTPTTSDGSLPTHPNSSSTTGTWGQPPSQGLAKQAVVEAAFDSGIDLFSGGLKATSTNSYSTSTTASTLGTNTASSGQPEKPVSFTAPKSKSTPSQLDGSMFGAEPANVSAAPPVVQVSTINMGGISGVGNVSEGPAKPGPIQMDSLTGGKPQASPGMPDSWPQMTQNDVLRYTKVFTQVDTDKDGKITGQQARELFLSWQLPRGILKQIWDLSDQDNDSMLSLHEFCTALYFMERHREGRMLPSVAPPGIHLPTLEGSIGQGPEGHGVQNTSVWRHIPGVPQAQAPVPHNDPSSRQPPVQASQTLQMPDRGLPLPGEGSSVREPYVSKVPVLEAHLVNQLSRDEQEMLKTKHKAAEEADKKVFELDKEISDYKEKIELYRAKLQEIILFKSRCDNRLNEVTESVATDRREMDTLSRKYDQRFKAAGEVSSRLQAEEAAFRDIQEKKMELYNAIAKLEKDGDGNDLLQTLADQISVNLDKLKKILNERGRALGVKPKSAIPIEVPFGFQGIPENSVEWDEDWDKFDDEGFMNAQDIMDDLTEDYSSTAKSAYSAPWGNGESLFDDGFDFSSEPTLHSDTFETGDEEYTSTLPKESHTDFRSAGGSDTFTRNSVESPDHDTSTSGSLHTEPTFDTSKSQRYSSMDSQDFGRDAIIGATSFGSPSKSFNQRRTSFNSSDPFGDSQAAWTSYEEDSDSGFRASWGQQASNPPSTQTSIDMSSSRSQTRFGKEQGSIVDSLDMDTLHVSSPRGALFDGSIRISSPGGFDKSIRESSPGARGFGGSSSPGWGFDRNGHDDYKNAFGSPRTAFDSPRSNAFGSPKNAFGSPKYGFGSPKNAFGSPKGSKSLFGGASASDTTPSLFGGSPGTSKRDGPYSSGSFLAFDSFGPGSPAAPARGSGASDDHNFMVRDGGKSMQRFDSFNSVKTDVERRRGFGSDDEADPFGPFGSTGPFSGGAQTPMHSSVWSAF